MLGRPARAHHRGAALVAAFAVTFLVAPLPGAAASPRAGAAVAAPGDTIVTPGVLEFEEMAPGTTEVRTATLTTAAPDAAAFVRAVVRGTGPLAGHLTTRVEACGVTWTAQGCVGGGVVLLAGPVAAGMDATIRVPVPASGVAHLRISLTLDESAPAGAASTVRHELHLVGPDAVPPEPVPPDSAGPLAVTGAEAAALGAAALALTALGLALRAWGRARRRAVAARWTR